MKNAGKFIMIFVVVFSCTLSSVEAAPTTYGSTGLIDIPTADVMRKDQLEIGYYNIDRKKYEVMALPVAKNLEISGVIRDENADHTIKAISAKVNVKQEGILFPSVAIGMYDVGNNDKRSLYVTASKALPFGLRLTAGVGNQYYKNGFVGLETKLIPLSKGGTFPDMSLMIERINKRMSYGLRLATAKGLQITAGWRDNTPFWALTYTVP